MLHIAIVTHMFGPTWATVLDVTLSIQSRVTGVCSKKKVKSYWSLFQPRGVNPVLLIVSTYTRPLPFPERHALCHCSWQLGEGRGIGGDFLNFLLVKPKGKKRRIAIFTVASN